MWRLQKGKSFLPRVSLETLNAAYIAEKNGKAKLRLLAAIRRKKGETIDEIATSLEKPRRTIHGWLHRFEQRGLRGSQDIKQPGRTPKLDISNLKKLRRELLRGPAHVPSKLWTTRILREHISSKYGVQYKRHNVIKLLHKLGFSIQKPRPRHFKADPVAQREFKKKQNVSHAITTGLAGRSHFWMSPASTSSRI